MSIKEYKAAKVNDLKNKEMKQVPVGDGKEILLTRIDDNYYALGAHCTHYSAPLAEGVLHNGVIMCPWHHACFNAKTGDMMEPPARDSLPHYDTKINGEDVIVLLPDELEMARTPVMVELDSSDERNFVIVGGGASANAAAQAMREAGYKGKITIVTPEDKVPYDRPNLSKAYLSGEAPPEWMPLRDNEFYKKYNIDFIYGKKVEEVDADRKEISLDNRSILKYDKLLLAAGGIPRKLDLSGSDLKNIFYLRSFDDCDKIIEAAGGTSKAVVIGASFIGMETAYHLHERKIDVTVVAPIDIPFKNIFGNKVGSLIKSLHEEHGIKFKLSSQASKFEGSSKVESVILSDGEKINCDFVVVGIGVTPGTSFIKGIKTETDGSLKVDDYLRVSDDIYAAGDVASFPFNGNYVRIEHWRVAEQQGRAGGFNMAGKKMKFNKQPFFWTEQAGLTLRYVGYAKEWDETIVLGNINSKEFITFFVKNNKAEAALSSSKDRELDAIEFLMLNNKMPSADKIKNGINLLKVLYE